MIDRKKNLSQLTPIVSGKKTDIHALASEAVDKLTDYITKSMPTQGILLGVVEAVILGPPMTTLTANLNGESVPNIRFLSTGVTPNVGDTVVVLSRNNVYICIGVLA